MKFLRFLLLVFGLGHIGIAAAAEGSDKPNIILILADDMGYSDLGCYGGEVSTPNLDKLAKDGIRFTQFYNCARCCPTRSSLLTGLYPHQAGIGHMVKDLGTPSYQGHLNNQCITIAEALRENGYHTLHSGKWHVGNLHPNWPFDRGFEHCFSLIGGGSSYFELKYSKMAIDDKEYTPPTNNFYMTDAITDAGVKFVSEYGKKSEPFFLYLAYTAPHHPLHALPEDIAKYRGKYLEGWDSLRTKRLERMIAMGLVDRQYSQPPRDSRVPAWSEIKDEDKDLWDLQMSVYAAQIDRMDQGIGKVLDKLSETGADKKTLVFFLSDNGACAELIDSGKPGAAPCSKESFQSYAVGWANLSDTPFRLYKHWTHEGGISTPLIVRWPGIIKENTITSQAGHVMDIMATCLDVANAKYPETHKGNVLIPVEGKSLVPILHGDSQPIHKNIFWEHEGNRAVREGNWKLVAKNESPWELYDLDVDRIEMNNLADKFPDRVKDMAAKYEAWAKKCSVLSWKEIRSKGSVY
jgi:arylsulfatase A-like enzyme